MILNLIGFFLIAIILISFFLKKNNNIIHLDDFVLEHEIPFNKRTKTFHAIPPENILCLDIISKINSRDQLIFIIDNISYRLNGSSIIYNSDTGALKILCGLEFYDALDKKTRYLHMRDDKILYDCSIDDLKFLTINNIDTCPEPKLNFDKYQYWPQFAYLASTYNYNYLYEMVLAPTNGLFQPMVDSALPFCYRKFIAFDRQFYSERRMIKLFTSRFQRGTYINYDNNGKEPA